MSRASAPCPRAGAWEDAGPAAKDVTTRQRGTTESRRSRDVMTSSFHPRASSNRARFAKPHDLGVRIAEAREHLVGVLAQARRRTLDAWTAVGELERGQRHGHRALDPLDRVVLVEHPTRLGPGCVRRL